MFYIKEMSGVRLSNRDDISLDPVCNICGHLKNVCTVLFNNVFICNECKNKPIKILIDYIIEENKKFANAVENNELD